MNERQAAAQMAVAAVILYLLVILAAKALSWLFGESAYLWVLLFAIPLVTFILVLLAERLTGDK